jgi:phage shock protein C
MPEAVARKLYRSEKNVVVAGVAGGLGEYFQVDPVLIRLIIVILVVFGGSGIPLYLILWLVLPKQSQVEQNTEATVRSNVEEISTKAKVMIEDTRTVTKNRPKQWLGVLLVAFGILFLLNNFTFVRFDLLWPFILIGIGAAVLLRS